MRPIKLPYVIVALLIAVSIVVGGVALFGGAFSRHPTVALDTFNSVYGTKGTKLDTCSTCHTSGRLLNSYGNDAKRKFSIMKASDSQTEEAQIVAFVEALKAIEPIDSDGDGFSNSEEITARTFPGDPSDHPPKRQ